MTKRLPPKRREPWRAFPRLAAALAGAAVVAALGLDYLASRSGGPAYLFARAPRAAAGSSTSTMSSRVQGNGLNTTIRGPATPMARARPWS